MEHNQQEPPHLRQTANAILHERRTLLPSVLALFGFQLLTVFTSPFQDGLDQTEQCVHFAAIILVALAIAALMTPVAYLRQAQHSESLSELIQLARRALSITMLSLAIAIPLELFLAACVILRGQLAIALGIAALVGFFVLWFALPFARRPR